MPLFEIAAEEEVGLGGDISLTLEILSPGAITRPTLPARTKSGESTVKDKILKGKITLLPKREEKLEENHALRNYLFLGTRVQGVLSSSKL